MEFPEALAGALARVARELPPRLPATRREACLARVSAESLTAAPGVRSVRREVAVTLSSWRGPVGALDVLIETEAGDRIGVEFKWWTERADGPAQTLWDAAKLATLQTDGSISAGYLISAGPRATWESATPLTRLFDDAGRLTLPLVRHSTSWWTGKARFRPGTIVPAVLVTERVTESQMRVDGGSYLLRAARVRPGAGRAEIPLEAPKAPPEEIRPGPEHRN